MFYQKCTNHPSSCIEYESHERFLQSSNGPCSKIVQRPNHPWVLPWHHSEAHLPDTWQIHNFPKGFYQSVCATIVASVVLGHKLCRQCMWTTIVRLHTSYPLLIWSIVKRDKLPKSHLLARFCLWFQEAIHRLTFCGLSRSMTGLYFT